MYEKLIVFLTDVVVPMIMQEVDKYSYKDVYNANEPTFRGAFTRSNISKAGIDVDFKLIGVERDRVEFSFFKRKQMDFPVNVSHTAFFRYVAQMTIPLTADNYYEYLKSYDSEVFSDKESTDALLSGLIEMKGGIGSLVDAAYYVLSSQINESYVSGLPFESNRYFKNVVRRAEKGLYRVTWNWHTTIYGVHKVTDKGIAKLGSHTPVSGESEKFYTHKG